MQDFKKEAARAAVRLIRPGSTIGFGAGSTIAHLVGFIKEDAMLASSIIHTVTSSFTTRLLLEKSGLPVREMGSTVRIDQYFDGCDQFDAGLNALKSGGGIHTREKIVAAMAHEFILIGDESKYAERLDGKYPLVIEVIPDALSFVLARLPEIFEGAAPVIRMNDKTDGAAISGNGNFLIDCRFTPFPEPGLLNEKVGMLPGVLEHSLFYGMAHKAIVAGDKGTIIKTP
ncbi:MAG TPA: ribose 5-phosphate isomerase A [Puia sp.]|nr:ribose 5-phosphate isomerase A [Puia sp.]